MELYRLHSLTKDPAAQKGVATYYWFGLNQTTGKIPTVQEEYNFLNGLDYPDLSGDEKNYIYNVWKEYNLPQNDSEPVRRYMSDARISHFGKVPYKGNLPYYPYNSTKYQRLQYAFSLMTPVNQQQLFNVIGDVYRARQSAAGGFLSPEQIQIIGTVALAAGAIALTGGAAAPLVGAAATTASTTATAAAATTAATTATSSLVLPSLGQIGSVIGTTATAAVVGAAQGQIKSGLDQLLGPKQPEAPQQVINETQPTTRTTKVSPILVLSASLAAALLLTQL